MKGISLWQPWASLVAHGHKTYETRKWGTSYRGPLLILATKRCDAGTIGALFHLQIALRDFGLPELPESLPLGCAVCLATLADCQLMPEAPDPLNEAFGNFGFGRYGWKLTDIRPLPEPIPSKGFQGIRDVSERLERMVWEALGVGAES